MKLVIALAIVFSSVSAWAATERPLEEELGALQLPDNQAPAGVTEEKLYSVQTRYSPLKFRNEFTLGGLTQLNGNSFVNTTGVTGAYRFHFSDRWSLALSGTYSFNSWTDSAKKLLELDARYPDVAYAKNRYDATVGFNVFYGKFRLSMDQVFYFDNYVALGAGRVGLNTGNQTAAVADVGFVLWLGKRGSIRLGVKDYFYKEQRHLSSNLFHDLVGHVDAGILFGGSGT